MMEAPMMQRVAADAEYDEHRDHRRTERQRDVEAADGVGSAAPEETSATDSR